ncbi:MAG: ATP-dependent DNA helicase RecG, partial [Acetobacteraceae bacterium]|nr:ATP-dependent DNA helicase RecG [Acetobacteraceae bacterium]
MSASQVDPLAPLFAPLTSLRGIGPTLANRIARAAGGTRVIDLLFHLPQSYLDRRDRPTISQVRPGRIATLAVEVVRHDPPAKARQPWKVLVKDATGFAELVFFTFGRQAQIPRGTRLLVSGKVEQFGDRLTLPHPDYIVPADRPEQLPEIEPVWPLTAGLSARQILAAMRGALAQLPNIPEWHDTALIRRERWPGFRAALEALQAPASPPSEAARRRLAYDELLANQVTLALARG